MSLSEAERPVLEALSKSQVAAHRDVQRAQVLLMASDGFPNERIATVVGVTSGRGRRKAIPESKIVEIVELTRVSTPEGGHSLVRAIDGGMGRGVPGPGAKDLGGTRPEAAPGGNIQALHGPPL